MNDKCFCHLNGYAVKDATARNEIEVMKEQYATKTYVDGVLSGGLDLDNFATKEELANAIKDIDFPEPDLTEYATKEYVDFTKPVVLYTNDDGSKEDITLSDSVANYSYIEIYFGDGGYDHGAERYYNINGKTFNLECAKAWENSSGKIQFEIKCSSYKADDNVLTLTNYGYVQTNETSIAMVKKTKYVVVYRVLGYK